MGFLACARNGASRAFPFRHCEVFFFSSSRPFFRHCEERSDEAISFCSSASEIPTPLRRLGMTKGKNRHCERPTGAKQSHSAQPPMRLPRPFGARNDKRAWGSE